MNFLDVIVIIPVLWGAFKGLKNGLISEVSSIIALILGIWAAINCSDFVAGYLKEYTSISEENQQIVAFAVTFIIVLLLCYLLSRILIKVCKSIKILWLDKLMGIMFGMSKYIIVIAFLFFVANSLIKSYATKPIEVCENSLFFKPMAETAESFVGGKISVPERKIPDLFEPFKHTDDEDN